MNMHFSSRQLEYHPCSGLYFFDVSELEICKVRITFENRVQKPYWQGEPKSHGYRLKQDLQFLIEPVSIWAFKNPKATIAAEWPALSNEE